MPAGLGYGYALNAVSVDESVAISEAKRLVAAAESAGLLMRVLGGVAVAIRCADVNRRSLREAYNDIDFATRLGSGFRIGQLLSRMGYEPASRRLSTLHSFSRMFFQHTAHGLKLDVFVGDLEMCHKIPLSRRLAMDRVTVTLADLFLSKLQIVRLTEKDVLDVQSLLLAYPAGSNAGIFDVDYIARLCARDWGLWRTVTNNLTVCSERTSERPLGEQPSLADSLASIQERLTTQRKSIAWRVRARVGERVRWYEEPEEIVL